MEASYALSIGICTGDCTTYLNGYALTSTAARRSSCIVTFAVAVPDLAKANVMTVAKEVNENTLNAKMVAFKAQISSSATVPEVTSVASPRIKAPQSHSAQPWSSHCGLKEP